jgi:hypothetical protein
MLGVMDVGEETWTYDFEPIPDYPAPAEEPVPAREPEPALDPQPA